METIAPAVLIVDDVADNRRVLSQALTGLDVRILEAHSGPEALAHAAKEPELCLVLLNVRIPGMDGYEVAEQLRHLSRSPSPAIIFMSAVESEIDRYHEACELGAVDFITQPISPPAILSKARVFLELFRQRRQLEILVKQLDTLNRDLVHQTRRLQLTTETSHQIASILDNDQLLAAIVELLQQRFDYDCVGIWVAYPPPPNAEYLTLQAGRYWTHNTLGPSAALRIPIDAPKSIIVHAWKTGRLYMTNDVTTDPYYQPYGRLTDIRAEVSMPLRFGEGMPIGVLDIQTRSDEPFSKGDVLALEALSNQIAVAIRNARLYAEVTRLNEKLEAQVDKHTRQLQETLQRLTLLERDKSDFIAIVSHELRTPLTLIRGFSQMLLEEPEILANPSWKRQVEGITNGAFRMQAIVDSMLDVARLDTRTLQLQYQPTDMAKLIESAIRETDDALQKRNLTLQVQDMQDLPEIEVDPAELRKVFNELLSNAIKFTPDGGKITITGQLLLPQRSDEDLYIEVVVSDTGIGIAPEVQDLIFSKFYRAGDVWLHSSGRTKFKGGGPGLGLALAQGIVQAHGGHIWVESPGYDEVKLPGSKFHVVLPVYQA